MGKDILEGRLGICLIGLVMGVLVAAGPQPAWAQETPDDGTPSAEESATDDTTESAASEDIGDDATAGGRKDGDDTAGEAVAELPASDAGTDETADAEADNGTPADSVAAAENPGAATAVDDTKPADGSATDSAETEEATTDGTAEAGTVAAAATITASQVQAEAAGGDPAQPAGESAVPGSVEADLLSDFDNAPPGTEATAAGFDEGVDGTVPADGAETETGDVPANNTSSATPASGSEPLTGEDSPYQYEAETLEDGDEDIAGTGDPLEGMNRAFFKFNDFLDKLVLKPVASVYRFIFPGYVQDRIRNVVNNADSPVILANDILQWKWDRAGNTVSRFFINTTLGIGGIWDVASSFGIERHTEDFGQTLCVWGVKEWVYLYLPFVGPTNPRDLTGSFVDRYFDPLTYYADIVQQVNLSDGVQIKWNVDRAGWARIALSSADLIDMRARNIDTINEIERTSIDFYTAVRSLYRQSRESACNDGQVDFEDLPDLSEEFE